MLYITTRQNRDAYTAFKALNDIQTPDGGLYIPYKIPSIDAAQLSQLAQCSFGVTVAYILNLFFSAQLTGWDIDVLAGRNPLKAAGVGRKTIVVQTWHNPGNSFDYAVESLYARLQGAEQAHSKGWAKIAIRIAYLFAVYGELLRNELITPENSFDVSVPMGDITDCAAVLYAMKMGLPIANMIVCSDENSAFWDLVHRGEISTSLLRAEQKLGLERLIHAVFGPDEAIRYQSACERHGVYIVPQEQNLELPGFAFGAVISKDRIGSVIANMFRTNEYLLSPRTAVCYAGVQDFRAKTGQSNQTVLFAEQDPIHLSSEISKVSGLPQDVLEANRKRS